MWDNVLTILWNILMAILILVVGWIAVKLVVAALKRYLLRINIDILLVNFAANILYWVGVLLVIIASLSALGVDTTALIALLGAAGLAVAIALQDSMKNFASGVLLIIFRPFDIGHFIEAGGASGIVEEITLFTSTLRTADNRTVIVPNGQIYANTITNNSDRATRRVDMVFGIGYEDDMRKARDIMMEILKADDRILDDPEPTVTVDELADSSVNFNVRPWCANADYWGVKADITERIKLAFDDNDISIPYPQMDVHMNRVEEIKDAPSDVPIPQKETDLPPDTEAVKDEDS